MTIPIQCPKCDCVYELDDSDAGQHVECDCGQILLVPDIPQTSQESADRVVIECPNCGSQSEVDTSLAGDEVECHCGQRLIVPSISELQATDEPATSFQIECPACKTPYILESELAGEEVECACGQRISLPQINTEAEEHPHSTDLDDGHQSNLSDELNAAVSVSCPECAAEYQLRVDDIGTTVECECGFQFSVPDPVDIDVSTDATELIDNLTPIDGELDLTAESSVTTRATTRSTTSAARVRTARKKAAPIWIAIGTIACLALIACGIMLFNGNGQPEISKPSNQIAEADSAASGANPKAQPKINSGVSAERDVDLATHKLDQNPEPKSAESSAAQSGSSNPQRADDSHVTQKVVPKANQGGSTNPNTLTKPDEFIDLATNKSTTAYPKSDKPAIGSEAPSVTTKPSPNSDATSTATVDTKATPRQEKKRVVFIESTKQFSSFRSAVLDAFKQYQKLESLRAKAEKSGLGTDHAAAERQLAITGGALHLSQHMIQADSDPNFVAQSRLLLAYCYLESQQFYEAGIISLAIVRWTPFEFVINLEPKTKSNAKTKSKAKSKTKRSKPDPSESAGVQLLRAGQGKPVDTKPLVKSKPINPGRKAVMMALTAFISAYEQAPADNRSAEYSKIVEVAELMEDRFEDHENVDLVRMHVARLHQSHAAKIKAATWYARVKPSSPDYVRSRLLAGQAYWSGYQKATNQRSSEDESVSPQVTGWKSRADTLLGEGIKAAADNADLRENVLLAKLTLGQLALRDRRFAAAVDFLTAEPLAVTTAVENAPTGGRPDSGIHSVPFAKLVYTTLLQALIGTNQSNEAVAALQTLQTIVGDDNAAFVARLHFELSQELMAAYLVSVKAGEPNVDMAKSIASSLAQCSRIAESLSVGSLLRVAMAAADVAAVVDDDGDAKALQRHAVGIMHVILKKGLSTPENERAVRFRLARSQAFLGEYETALKECSSILEDLPNAFDIQIEAAHVLQTWGTDASLEQHLVAAISGPKEYPQVWGWAKMSQTLQLLMQKNSDSRQKYFPRFLSVRLNIARCRHAHAKIMTDPNKRKTELKKALSELRISARLSKNHEAPIWQELNQVYLQIQKSTGTSPKPLF